MFCRNASIAAAISRFNAKKNQPPELPSVAVPKNFVGTKANVAEELESFAQKEIVDDNGT